MECKFGTAGLKRDIMKAMADSSKKGGSKKKDEAGKGSATVDKNGGGITFTNKLGSAKTDKAGVKTETKRVVCAGFPVPFFLFPLDSALLDGEGEGSGSVFVCTINFVCLASVVMRECV